MKNPGYPAIKIVKNYGKLPNIECYAGQLNQVFMNIINNAVDALREREKKCSLGRERSQPQPDGNYYFYYLRKLGKN
jgi:two-component system NtrC family sensor kinase